MTAMTREQLEARLAELETQNKELVRKNERKLSLKVSEKGGVSLYGLGRFPVTLYKGQWEKVVEYVPEIRKFLEENASRLVVKE